MTELIVAVDSEPSREARVMIGALIAAGVRWFKIGVPMLLRPGGRRTADFIRHFDAHLLLDTKTYDTHDTVLRTVDAAVEIGAAMMTVHADCVIHTIGERRLKILAVRELTDGASIADGHSDERMADGIICSVQHASDIRSLTDKLLACPGIRPAGWPSDNHVSAATPAQARQAGADYIVVGRPIYGAPDPVAAARAILGALSGGEG